MLRISALCIVLGVMGCKNTEDNSVASGENILPPGTAVCEEFGDHSCFDGSESFGLTKKQCEYLKIWELGDPAVFYIKSSNLGAYIELNSDGAIFYSFNLITEEHEAHEIRRKSVSFRYKKNDCRCQVSFKNGLVDRVIVESSYGDIARSDNDTCQIPEPL